VDGRLKWRIWRRVGDLAETLIGEIIIDARTDRGDAER
jgi:hypothetical protein